MSPAQHTKPLAFTTHELDRVYLGVCRRQSLHRHHERFGATHAGACKLRDRAKYTKRRGPFTVRYTKSLDSKGGFYSVRPRSNPWIERQDGVAGRSSLIRRAPRAALPFLRTLFFLGFAAGMAFAFDGLFFAAPPRTITGFFPRTLPRYGSCRSLRDDEPLMPFDALQQIRHVTIGKSILRTPELDDRLPNKASASCRRRESTRGGWPYQTRDSRSFPFHEHAG